MGTKIILTGLRQVGKSTALNRFLAENEFCISGFRTIFDNCETPTNRSLLLCPLPNGMPYTPVIWDDGNPMINLNVFNRCVPPLLERSADLYVMDELGKFECDANEMRIAVEKLFSREEATIIAIIRYDAPGWIGALKLRKNVTTITVTEKNRNEIPTILTKLLK